MRQTLLETYTFVVVKPDVYDDRGLVYPTIKLSYSGWNVSADNCSELSPIQQDNYHLILQAARQFFTNPEALLGLPAPVADAASVLGAAKRLGMHKLYTGEDTYIKRLEEFSNVITVARKAFHQNDQWDRLDHIGKVIHCHEAGYSDRATELGYANDPMIWYDYDEKWKRGNYAEIRSQWLNRMEHFTSGGARASFEAYTERYNSTHRLVGRCLHPS